MLFVVSDDKGQGQSCLLCQAMNVNVSVVCSVR